MTPQAASVPFHSFGPPWLGESTPQSVQAPYPGFTPSRGDEAIAGGIQGQGGQKVGMPAHERIALIFVAADDQR
jgi:hypothetical protein